MGPTEMDDKTAVAGKLPVVAASIVYPLAVWVITVQVPPVG